MKKVGFIGLGTMGLPMSCNIAKKGFKVFGFDLNKDRIELAKSKGINDGKSIKNLASSVDVLFTMVPAAKHAITVYDEIFDYAKKDLICVDMSTIEPSVHVSITEKGKEYGVRVLDAPVVKSEAAAIDGTLGIYVGGDEDTYNEIKDIIACMGNNIIYMGDSGRGMLMKICHNMFVAQIQNGLNEMLCLAHSGGIGVEEAITALSIGGADCLYMHTKKANLANGEYKPAFSIRNMHKDVHIAQTIANERKLKLYGLNKIVEVYDDSLENMADLDFSATYETVKRRCNNEG
ncbi:MAG: NAD(P)-dependent oxidoreductase [Erysipelotrichaceae bacterium]|nr:NAD(P)-dependent oxidoreductase [Erysipelotrichaceae bacterium]